LHDFRGAQQIGEIRVIRERDGGIHAVASPGFIPKIWLSQNQCE
jgi:hypothetical protein